MKPSGWLFIALSWGMILILFAFSLARTLRHRDEEDREGQKGKC